jgi:membrane protein
MAKTGPGVTSLLKESVRDFLKDDCMDSAAALSYYTIFSLPAILVLMLTLISAVMNPSDVRGGLEGQLQALMGRAQASRSAPSSSRPSRNLTMA